MSYCQHDIVGDIEATCEKIAILDSGRVLYQGTVNRLLAEADGSVFTKTADRAELPSLKKNLFITSMHTQGTSVSVRFWQKTPCPAPMPVHPILRMPICIT